MARDHAKQTGIALEKAYQFTLWLIPTVEKFPRTHKFVLGDRIETAALDVVEGLIEATYTTNATGPKGSPGRAARSRGREPETNGTASSCF